MKKLSILLIFLLTIILLCGFVQAVEPKDAMETNTASNLISLQQKNKKTVADYTELYGSESYGMAAYIINIVRIYSIPICLVGIAIGAMYQYVVGTRRLDMRHRGFTLIVATLTLLVICQVLPLVFAIVVKGWR